MATLQIENVSKRFGKTQAVKDVSFVVNPGEIFGLLGPNGAGKTTILRMILDIFKPDKGKIAVLGGAMTETKKNDIGYLPEERGLYQDIPVERCLQYLASLKGMEKAEIDQQLPLYLKKFDLTEHRRKKVKELSKGMQQKAQLITALIHNPSLIIIDEPFSALDPVNTQLVKELLIEQRNLGKAVVMCTHQMRQVEELCDRLVLIDQGEVMLYGTLMEVRKQFARPELLLLSESKLPASLPGVTEISSMNNEHKLKLQPGVSSQDVLKFLLDSGIEITSFEVAMPTLDDIFIEVVREKGQS